MLKTLPSEKRAVYDVVNIVAGVALALSPLYFGFTTEVYAAWNAVIIGAAVTVIALASALAFHKADEWMNFGLGLWAMLAPWMLNFSGDALATLAHVVGGLAVVAAATRACSLSHRPYSKA